MTGSPGAGGAARAAQAAKRDVKPMKCGSVRVDRDGFVSDKTGVKFDARGAKAAVESGQQVGSRVTATRVLAVGVFALAAKKNMNTVFLTITSANGDKTIIEELRAKKHEGEARRFAADFNTLARKL